MRIRRVLSTSIHACTFECPSRAVDHNVNYVCRTLNHNLRSGNGGSVDKTVEVYAESRTRLGEINYCDSNILLAANSGHDDVEFSGVTNTQD